MGGGSPSAFCAIKVEEEWAGSLRPAEAVAIEQDLTSTGPSSPRIEVWVVAGERSVIPPAPYASLKE